MVTSLPQSTMVVNKGTMLLERLQWLPWLPWLPCGYHGYCVVTCVSLGGGGGIEAVLACIEYIEQGVGG